MDQSGKKLATSEEALRAVFVNGAAPTTGPIVLVEYDPAWPELFRREEARIRGALGAAARLVEHVGSTSVPGLAAKPILDLVLAVPDASDEPAYVPALERAGYVLRIREPDWHQHRLFKGPEVDLNLHVFSYGCPEIDRMLVFRDRLRANDADRRRYDEAKRALAARPWKLVQHYADAKTGVIEAILAAAQRGA